MLKSRRRRQSQPVVLEQFLTFIVRQEQFAVPMAQAYRVIPLPPIHGDPYQRGIGLVTYENREILVIDIGRCLFDAPLSTSETEKLRFLLILQPRQEWLGLPLTDPPMIERIPQEAIHPIPRNYLHWGSIHNVSSLMVTHQGDQELPPIFIVDIEQVLHTLKTR
ncbi:blue light phototaxis adaptor protein CheW family [Thermosynechococcus sp. NK55a]|jgi:chemotaxis signal transduction protein|uniref:chemotaxis protein CheW n=1 Tax=unclassified Thermosynechococcus TaxID=2622553 RepID=UPI0003D92E2B|nr:MULTISPECIES: chemotaxis protein CheW [unclassified Thermosynechococcus]AHB89594.1 blue light phototaxis adaptor protein CheW family [Thermosynechococcus sp. NK55a]RMH67357.1 MAG: chemotaxis protein CheW [Cyanobacteria bacterium J003]HIK23602.1 chemotaxis protein CheW [Thermosynechococcus sp. M3746_W2019_013]